MRSTRLHPGSSAAPFVPRLLFPQGPTAAIMSTLPQQKLDEVRSIFSAFLKKRNKRQTPERFVILEEIYKTDDHVDADELYVRLKQEGTQVSRATVYNTLELLMECELVVRHQFGKNQAKYERAYSYWQHDHLICLDCNELFEFCDPRLQGIQEMVADIYEFEIKHHSLNMYGHCVRENCPNRSEDESGSETELDRTGTGQTNEDTVEAGASEPAG